MAPLMDEGLINLVLGQFLVFCGSENAEFGEFLRWLGQILMLEKQRSFFDQEKIVILMLIVHKHRGQISGSSSLLQGYLEIMLCLEDKLALFSKAHHDITLQIIKVFHFDSEVNSRESSCLKKTKQLILNTLRMLDVNQCNIIDLQLVFEVLQSFILGSSTESGHPSSLIGLSFWM